MMEEKTNFTHLVYWETMANSSIWTYNSEEDARRVAETLAETSHVTVVAIIPANKMELLKGSLSG